MVSFIQWFASDVSKTVSFYLSELSVVIKKETMPFWSELLLALGSYFSVILAPTLYRLVSDFKGI